MFSVTINSNTINDRGKLLAEIEKAKQDETHPFLFGHRGFQHAIDALQYSHKHLLAGAKSKNLTMKYDGSPSLVFGRHPETGRFFVASKSAFNKNPKINYTPEDIERNHGHAPGLVEKLKAALQHLPKVAPKSGVYQGDVMYTHPDLKHNHDGSVSFTPNTITYTSRGNSDKIKKSHFGIAVHTRYHGNTLDDMRATQDVNENDFGQHPDIFLHNADHDTSKAHYSQDHQNEFNKHLKAAQDIHDTHGHEMYNATSKHHGEGNHLVTYINHTVRGDEAPSVEGFTKFLQGKYNKEADKLKTDKGKQKRYDEMNDHLSHVMDNKHHYENMFTMHHHLQQAKNSLVNALESHEGQYTHSINGNPSKPEGFVVNDGNRSSKLVNRAEFAKQNLLRNRG